MIKPIEETVTVTERRVVSNQIYCDECKKLIAETTVSPPMYDVQYWEVTTGHYDWGNDSCDSIERYQYCSRDCLKKAFDKYIDETENRQNSQYFEVQNCRTRSNRR